MANDYTTAQKVFDEIPEGSFSALEMPNIATYVTAASRLIDLFVGRQEGFFYPTTDDATYYYDGSGCDEQYIDEFASITSVSVAEQGGTSSTDYTLWSSSDYLTEPYNATNKGKPIYKLVIDPNSNKFDFPRYRKAVKVIGIAGYSVSVNPLIAQATRIQAVRWAMRARGGWQDVSGNESMGQLRYKAITELDGDVRAMLHRFVLELS